LTLKLKSVEAEIMMQYNTGDQLKYTASSGHYRTTITDVPSENKTITFEFVDCKDPDDNVYPIVQLGTQFWMAENLKTTTYNDKNGIPLETDDFLWESMTSPGYCWYNNDQETYGNQYGALYNWYAVETGKLCPAGWHVPTDEEWTSLSDYLAANGFAYLGTGVDIAKSMATTWGWNDEDTESGHVGHDPEKNNSSGFSGPPAGLRGGRSSMGSYGSYNIGNRGQWWSSTENSANAYTRHFIYYQTDLNRAYAGKSVGLSVRCVLTK
ncbi:MAG: fibrobacter succinogenes major paralogous domain-containing protein, partial [Prolixibacteraceae bacterium]|nr:fibrobacter succinogenes major paralogous domain-containing protein [Prolixibacteraceae bacterium]